MITENKTDQEWLLWKDPRNIGKLISFWKRHFDTYAAEKMQEMGYSWFRMAQMPLLMNISVKGTTNTELANAAFVSKQAQSKVVKELLEHDLIKIEKHGKDGRSQLIFLTEKGEKLVIEAKKCMSQLSVDYAAILGTERFEILKDCMSEIIDFHLQSQPTPEL